MSPHNSGFVYLIASEIGRYKIGLSKNPKNRLKELSTGSPAHISLVNAWPVSDMLVVERILHSVFYKKRKIGEWFELTREDIVQLETLAIKHSDKLPRKPGQFNRVKWMKSRKKQISSALQSLCDKTNNKFGSALRPNQFDIQSIVDFYAPNTWTCCNCSKPIQKPLFAWKAVPSTYGQLPVAMICTQHQNLSPEIK